MKALVKEYEVRLVERPMPAVPRGWVLVKVLSAAWGGLEDAIAANVVWVEPGRVLGMQGYGVVVELGVGANPRLSGKRVVVGRLPTPYGVAGYSARLWSRVYEVAPLPGTAYDGWLAEYVALPASALTDVGRADPVHAALATSLAIAWVAGRELAVAVEGERVAVVGGGPTALLAAYASRELGKEAAVYAPGGTPWVALARDLGLEVSRLSDLAEHVEPGRGLDAVFIATLDPDAAQLAAEAVGPEGTILLHPAYSYVRPPHTVKGLVKLLTSFPGGAGVTYAKRLGDDVVEKLAATVRGLGEPGAPRPKPFTVYLLEDQL